MVGEDGIETPSEMAEYIGITRASTSRLLTAMQARGLVRRTGAASPDGRQVTLALTEDGQQILIRNRPAADAVAAHFNAKLSPEQARILMQALAILAQGEGKNLTRL